MAARWSASRPSGANPKSDRRRSAGAQSHAHGHAFEQRLDELHEHYRSAGRAWVVKVPAPYRVIRPPVGGRFLGAFEGGGPPDYAGIVAGHAVAFDAKQTSDDRWSFAALAYHQAGHLEEISRQGGFAFVLLWMDGVVRVVPWTAIGPRWRAWHDAEKVKRGEGSLSIADLNVIGHRCQGYDWLSVVVRLLGAL